MSEEQNTPALSWYHIGYDIINNQTHCHIQGANGYKNLRFIWTLNVNTGVRKSRFFIRGVEYDTLNEAIEAWREKYKPKRNRVRLGS